MFQSACWLQASRLLLQDTLVQVKLNREPVDLAQEVASAITKIPIDYFKLL